MRSYPAARNRPCEPLACRVVLVLEFLDGSAAARMVQLPDPVRERPSVGPGTVIVSWQVYAARARQLLMLVT